MECPLYEESSNCLCMPKEPRLAGRIYLLFNSVSIADAEDRALIIIIIKMLPDAPYSFQIMP